MDELKSLASMTTFDRPSLALGNLVRGDFEAAARALVAPRSLSPSEARTLADDLGVGQGNTIYDLVVRSVTNPIALAGIILATKFPIPRADAMFQYSQRLVKSMGPIMRRLGSVDDLYRGTEIPELYKKILREVELFRRTYADRIGSAILEAERNGLKFDRRMEVLLSAKLDGLDTGRRNLFAAPINAGPVFDKLVSDIRNVMDDVWDQNFGTLLKQANLSSKAFHRIMNQLKAQYIFETEPLKKLERYFPHQVTKSLQQFDRRIEAMIAAASSRQSVYAEQAMVAAGDVTSRHALPRRGVMIPDAEDLAHVKDLLKPGVLEDLQKKAQSTVWRASSDQKIRVRVPMPRYSLRFLDTMTSYLHGMARAWGWSIAEGRVVADPAGVHRQRWVGMGERLVEAVDKFSDDIDPVRGAWMKDSYIPMGLGRLSFQQALKASEWNQYKIKLADTLEHGALGRWLSTSDEGSRIKDWMTTTLRQDRGVFSLQNLGGRAAGYLYLSTLGLNPVSAGYNILQTILTTVPTIGPKYTLTGISKTLEKAPRYFKARAEGLTHEQALAKSFPQFAAQGLGGSPVSDDAINRTLASSWDTALRMPTKVSDAAARVKAAMMAMFSTTEITNRLVAFEGALAKATAEGLSVADATAFARRVTEMTQFVGGPAGSPAFMREWHPLARQFLSFGTRTAGFLMGPGLSLGSGIQSFPSHWPIIGGLNPGTLGRTLVSSALAYEAGQVLFDKDLSHGLLFGALPIPNPRQPFSPFPFVPPAASILGAVGQDLLKGEFSQTKFVLPLLVPGGIALSRLSTAVAPEAAKALGKDFADYSHPTPDGRIPLYSSEGSLRGYFTPAQIWAKSLGIVGGTVGQQEQELIAYLLAQRDRIRAYRKNYLDALVAGNTTEADEIRREFETVYPGMGGLTFTEADYRAVHLRMMVPRLERTLDTIPKDLRPHFGQLIAVTLAGEARNLLGVDPILLQAPISATQRDPWRDMQSPNPMETLANRADLTQTQLPSNPGGHSFSYPIPGVQRNRTSRHLDSFSGGSSPPAFLDFSQF